jgi:uncharacterized protein (DUF433 family)
VNREALASPLYEPAEAARLVGLSRGQVSRWLFGYSYPYREQLRRQDPLVRRQLGTRAEHSASFLDLVELRAAKLFLDRGGSPQKVRRAFREAQEICDEPFPFASRKVYAAGSRLFLEQNGRLLELLTGGQWAIEPVLRDYLEQLEFDDQSGLANTWWPMGRGVPVLVTPRRAFGSPTVQTHNIKTSSVFDLYLAEGRHVEPVARWFGLASDEVAAAVRYEEALDERKVA